MSPQRHVKDPSHSAKSAGGRLYLNTHTPLTQRSRSGLTIPSRHSVGTDKENELTRIWSGNVAHYALSSLSHCGLILAYRMKLAPATALISTLKKKKSQAGNDSSRLHPKSSHVNKKPTTTTHIMKRVSDSGNLRKNRPPQRKTF